MKGQSSFNKMLIKIVMVLFVGLLAWAYQNTYPPPPSICGSPGGPPITGPRVVLRDGRHLAYNEYGVSRNIAKYKIVFAHGFGSSRFDASVYHSELFEELKIYMVTFDRPGYGESDPDPKRTIKSLALDIEDLADKLELGSKFYVIAYSMGQQGAWGSLKYIPHRLQPLQDQWAVGVSHYVPWLVYWWNTQNLFPGSSVISGKPNFSPSDWELLAKSRGEGSPTSLQKELFEELKIYMVTFDRPGSGESGPDPKRTIKSLALDMEDLADRLKLGSRFYVIAYSMGQKGGWGSLKYIPHRLAGVALIALVVNYWWSSFPSNLSMAAYKLQPIQDQWAVGVSHYMPWWNTQKRFPCSSVIAGKPNFSPSDWKLFAERCDEGSPMPVAKRKAYVRQQGLAESIFRDMRVGFGKWEFDPTEIENPFPNNEGSVYLWHGEDDRLVPVSLLRYMAKKLPWIHYHELPGVGHLLPNYDGKKEAILKSLLLRE